jgi:hypothetical protein
MHILALVTKPKVLVLSTRSKYSGASTGSEHKTKPSDAAVGFGITSTILVEEGITVHNHLVKKISIAFDMGHLGGSESGPLIKVTKAFSWRQSSFFVC